MNKTYIAILIFLFTGKSVYSTEQDSLIGNADSSTISSFGYNRHIFERKNNYSDTSLNGVQWTLPLELRGGIIGPREKLFCDDHQAPCAGFNLGFNDNDVFHFCLDSVKFFSTRTPYTDLKPVFSSKKEQYFKLLHTQNITKNWNIALQLLRTNGDGFYLRQSAVSNNASISSNYLSKNSRYAFQVVGIARNFKKDENGGVKSDSILASNIFADKKLFEVKLSDSRSRRGYYEFYLKQFLFFGPEEGIKTKDTLKLKRVIPKSYLYHSIQYSESYFVYSDKMPQSGFYQNIFLDSNTTLDSTHLTKMENQICFGTIDNSRINFLKNVNVEFGVKHQFVRVNQLKKDSLFNDLILTGSLLSRDVVENRNHFLFNGNYFFNGDHRGDYYLKGRLERELKKKECSVAISAFSKYASPDYIFTKYISNNFQWYNNFDKKTEKNVSVMIQELGKRIFKVKAELNFNSIYNYVYFDSTFLPKQLNGNVNIFSLAVTGNFDLKHWHFHNKIIFQKVGDENIVQDKISLTKPDRKNVVRIPSVVSFHSFYYSGKWFKKVMDVQLGADVFYFSSYYADAYMPAVEMFYIQNRKQIGNYPFVDLFFNAKIKRARVFVKMEHFASGLLGSNYYIAPNYPGNDRQIRFGVSWKFFD